MDQLVDIVNLVITFLWIAIVARAILSWFPGGWNNPIGAFIIQVTEPILAPLRRIIPTRGPIDISPMVAIIILIVIQQVLARLVSS